MVLTSVDQSHEFITSATDREQLFCVTERIFKGTTGWLGTTALVTGFQGYNFLFKSGAASSDKIPRSSEMCCVQR